MWTTHDYETKKNHVLRFLDEGDKVKATIFFRGREMTRTSLGRQILERLIKDVQEQSIVEFRPRRREHAARDPGPKEIGPGTREGKRKGSQAKAKQERMQKEKLQAQEKEEATGTGCGCVPGSEPYFASLERKALLVRFPIVETSAIPTAFAI